MAIAVAVAFSETTLVRRGCARALGVSPRARPCTVVRLLACSSDAWRMRRPCARSPPRCYVPPAPDTSLPIAPQWFPHALAAGWLPVAVPPAPGGGRSKLCSGRTAAPTPRSNSHSVAPSPIAASLVPVSFPVGSTAVSGPAAKLRLPSLARPSLRRCPGRDAGGPQCACGRRSPGNVGWSAWWGCCPRPGPRQSASAGPLRPTRPATGAGVAAPALADVASVGPVGETPVACEN